MKVTAPASSANLGPGFDCLGLALDLGFDLVAEDGLSGDVSASGVPQDASEHAGPAGLLRVEATHPAHVAYLAAGGDPAVPLWWRSPIPPGRGLGFSGAARVAGAFMALAQREAGALAQGTATPASEVAIGLGGVGASAIAAAGHVDQAFRIASELEGHPDNAAASAYGGFCVARPGHAIRVEPPAGLFDQLAVIVWSPSIGTSTRSARTKLPENVPFEVATASIEGAATWVAAIASGRLRELRSAAQDCLHQPQRLSQRPEAAAVLAAVNDSADTVAAWLSGSGPSVAALVDYSDAEPVAQVMKEAGREAAIRILRIAAHGVRVVE